MEAKRDRRLLDIIVLWIIREKRSSSLKES
jgi:hypothetical protein